MKIPRNTNLLIEPPSVATGDIAFNLLIFFLVCASSQPSGGRRQEIPKAEQNVQKQQAENIEVTLTRTSASINGQLVGETDFLSRMRQLLTGKAKPEDRIVVVKIDPQHKDTSYQHWIKITGLIEEAGGVITIQLEDSR